MRLKTNNFVIYLYNLLAKGLKEITFTQNISLLFKHHNSYKAIAFTTIWNYYVIYKLKHKWTNKSINFINLIFLHMQGILVPFASAIQLSNNNNYKIEDANHLTICKPPNKDHPSYSLLLKCLRICIEVKTSNLSLLTSYIFM